MLFNQKIRPSYFCDGTQQSPLLLCRFVSMLICIRRSKYLLLQFQSFECSSSFASNSCVYCTTRYNKCGRIGAKSLFLFTVIKECCVVLLIADLDQWGSYPPADLDRGVQIREESKSARGPNQLAQFTNGLKLQFQDSSYLVSKF